jgi:methionyl-tRNA formyltransferase
MRIVFFGTPEYVLPILNEVNKAFKGKRGESPIECVVTQPPKPVGRSKLIKFSAVDDWAHKRNIPKYFNPNDLLENDVHADLGILASYGMVVPNEVIKMFPHGILVIHPSLLPEFRGSSPVPAAIITDTNPTGVTIFKMDTKLDHGPIVNKFKEEILPDDTYESLRNRLFERSAEILVETIPPYVQGKTNPRVQDETLATYAKIIDKEDSFISPKIIKAVIAGKTPKVSWNIKFISKYKVKPTPETIERLYRAMQPWPGIWTTVQITKGVLKRLKIIKLHLDKGSIVFDEVQLEGKNPVTWKQFLGAYKEFLFVDIKNNKE